MQLIAADGAAGPAERNEAHFLCAAFCRRTLIGSTVEASGKLGNSAAAAKRFFLFDAAATLLGRPPRIEHRLKNASFPPQRLEGSGASCGFGVKLIAEDNPEDQRTKRLQRQLG